MPHAYVWHDSFICVTWLIHMCDMTHSYGWHRLIHMCNMTDLSVRHDSLIRVTWLVYMCNLTDLCVWHDSFICNFSYMRHGSIIWRSRLIHTCDYGVATISRLLQIIGLFCKRALQKRLYSVKETYNFKKPTNRSHPIPDTHLSISYM